ncbi:hypothetical protein BB561_003436 [Smittium simulii]|uniref:WSC domain-containing protein n=1 Tax=Smittium simulii TaxID=133385 RepID=A0A2T9YLD7_9FUNG|nr:hypothetical protein BB561_003436 [Smittium simulii]
MKFTLLSALLAISTAVASASIGSSELVNSNSDSTLDKRYSRYSRPRISYRPRVSRWRPSRGRRSAYYRYGRYWVWDNQVDTEFITTLRHRPRQFYGQRFQYLYLYVTDFRTRWNSDIRFRSTWDTQYNECERWFSRIPYNSWTNVQCDNDCSVSPNSGYSAGNVGSSSPSGYSAGNVGSSSPSGYSAGNVGSSSPVGYSAGNVGSSNPAGYSASNVESVNPADNSDNSDSNAAYQQQ